MLIHHLTLSATEGDVHRLDTIPVEAVKILQEALLPDGGQVPTLPAYRVKIRSPYFVLLRGSEPLLTCGLGYGDDAEAIEVWAELAGLQAAIHPVLAQRPSDAWWLITVLLPGLRNVPSHEYGWIADFQCCMAAAMLLDPETDTYPG